MKTLLPFILIALSIGLFAFVIRPYNEKVKTANITLVAKRDESKNSDRLVTDKKRIEAEYLAISEEEKNRLKRVLPDTIDNVRLALDIDQLALRRKISIGPISIESDLANPAANRQRERGAASQLPDYGTIRVNFSFRADYTSFIVFLQDLEHSQRLVDVTALRVSKIDNSPIYGFEVTLQTYWLR